MFLRLHDLNIGSFFSSSIQSKVGWMAQRFTPRQPAEECNIGLQGEPVRVRNLASSRLSPDEPLQRG
jgi:hypothetical protein